MKLWILVRESDEEAELEVRAFESFNRARLAMQYHVEDMINDFNLDYDHWFCGSDYAEVEYGRHTMTWQLHETEVE